MQRLLALLTLCSVAVAAAVELHEVDSPSWSGDKVRQFSLSFANQANSLLQCTAFAAKYLLSNQLLVFIAYRARCLKLPRNSPMKLDKTPSMKVFVTSLETCWTTIQHRVDNTTDFYRNWTDYAVGFGQEPSRNFWIGLRTLHWLTSPTARTLRVRMKKWDDTEHWAEYSSFSVADETDKFRLRVFGFSSSSNQVGDSMATHNGLRFSTFDSDNDLLAGNCPQIYKGAWWHRACHLVNGNGLYYNLPEAARVPTFGTGISWYYRFGYAYSMKEFEMLIQ
uniref:Fibrinogen C-terminal domain-containing protein n=1 Tax=Macrostomum lignano TaxID=282301 RepID=A0A1I8GA62_9PLAT